MPSKAMPVAGSLRGRLSYAMMLRAMSIRRLLAVVRKELLHIVRDPRNVFLVTLSPAFLLFLLSYVFSFDVGNIRLAVLDLDRSSLSRQYLASLTNGQDLTWERSVSSQKELLTLLRSGAVEAGVVIPHGFAEKVQSGSPAQVQAIVDGTDPFTGRKATSSLVARSAAFVAGRAGGSAPTASRSVQVRTQAWYNAGRKSLWSMVPGLLAIVLIMPALAFALALTRESETGTLEGLMTTPLTGFEYLAGKLLAYVSAALLSAFLAWLVALLWFHVPFRGSLGEYLLLATAYFVASMGATVVIAHFVRSQQAAMFIVLLVFIVPSFFLSGLISPVSTGSPGAMLTSYALPSTHFVTISRAVFLKGLHLAQLRTPALVLLGMGSGALLLGLLLFKKRVA
jgi:ABC-2 type transport system permease protein